jgi:hypothetical protein
MTPTRLRTWCTTICCAVTLTIQSVTVQAETVYQESYVYGGHVSPQEGCKLAEQAIKREAVAQQCGSLMRGGAVRFKSESVDDLFRLHFETTGGRVTQFDSRVIHPAEAVVETNTLLFCCTVEAKVSVQCDQGQRDPAFIPTPESQVKLNETAFREGETMQLSIQMPADLPGLAYASVVQLLPYLEEEQRVWRLYPNPYQPSQALHANDQITLPNAAYSLETSLPKGRKSVEEVLMVVFSRKPISFPETMTIEQFHRVLAELPLNERREMVLAYRIDAATAKSIRP